MKRSCKLRLARGPNFKQSQTISNPIKTTSKSGNRLTGARGEEQAVQFLEQEGYQILERNWVHKNVEVDIVARFHEFLVIVEVKTRKSNDYGEPYTAVDIRKQRSLIYAAERYLYSHHLDLEVRFDIISIIIASEKTVLEHIKDAFRAVAR